MDEFEFIKKIAKGVPESGEGLIKGMGDDAAVIEGPRGMCWLVTTDVLAEGVHFQRNWSDWKTIGKKALLVNISDIAAMGGVPWFYFVSVSCPADVSPEDLLNFDKGMKAIAEEYGMILAGGDTTSSKDGFFVSLTVVGSIEADNVIYRGAARPGDKIFVTGSLGGSVAGMACLNKGFSGKKYENFIKRHLLPEPRVELACWLSKHRFASSMIDISDGLKADIGHIADMSGVGYKIRASSAPVFEGLSRSSAEIGVDALEAVFAGGEEYELLFNVAADKLGTFIAGLSKKDFGCNISEIGEIVEEKKVRVILDDCGREINLSHGGFTHEIGK